MNRVYTEATDRLRKLFDDYKGVRYGKSGSADFFDNCNPLDVTGFLTAKSNRADGYYERNNYKKVSEQEFIDIIGFDKSNDNVNNPSHYAKGGIECIDAIKDSMSAESFLGYLKGNVQKYVWRYEDKANPIEDLEKASWYLNRLIKEKKDLQNKK